MRNRLNTHKIKIRIEHKSDAFFFGLRITGRLHLVRPA